MFSRIMRLFLRVLKGLIQHKIVGGTSARENHLPLHVEKANGEILNYEVKYTRVGFKTNRKVSIARNYPDQASALSLYSSYDNCNTGQAGTSLERLKGYSMLPSRRRERV
jgi:hypothetical protein